MTLSVYNIQVLAHEQCNRLTVRACGSQSESSDSSLKLSSELSSELSSLVRFKETSDWSSDSIPCFLAGMKLMLIYVSEPSVSLD